MHVFSQIATLFLIQIATLYLIKIATTYFLRIPLISQPFYYATFPNLCCVCSLVQLFGVTRGAKWNFLIGLMPLVSSLLYIFLIGK